jgi:TRAP transporter TAXI family solute receptor
VIALRLLEVAGVDDLSKRQLGVGESVQALRDGSIEGFFWSGGVPTGAVTDLATTDKIRILDLQEYLAPMRERFGEAYAEAEVEEGGYEGVAATPTIGVPNVLMVNEDMDEEIAFSITEALYAGKDRLATVVPAAESLDPAKGREMIGPIELHPGAERFYQEQGG